MRRDVVIDVGIESQSPQIIRCLPRSVCLESSSNVGIKSVNIHNERTAKDWIDRDVARRDDANCSE